MLSWPVHGLSGSGYLLEFASPDQLNPIPAAGVPRRRHRLSVSSPLDPDRTVYDFRASVASRSRIRAKFGLAVEGRR
jgi:hypothetical protein